MPVITVGPPRPVEGRAADCGFSPRSAEPAHDSFPLAWPLRRRSAAKARRSRSEAWPPGPRNLSGPSAPSPMFAPGCSCRFDCADSSFADSSCASAFAPPPQQAASELPPARLRFDKKAKRVRGRTSVARPRTRPSALPWATLPLTATGRRESQSPRRQWPWSPPRDTAHHQAPGRCRTPRPPRRRSPPRS